MHPPTRASSPPPPADALSRRAADKKILRRAADFMKVVPKMRIKGWLAELAGSANEHTHRQNRNKNEDKWAYVGCYNIERVCTRRVLHTRARSKEYKSGA